MMTWIVFTLESTYDMRIESRLTVKINHESIQSIVLDDTGTPVPVGTKSTVI